MGKEPVAASLRGVVPRTSRGKNEATPWSVFEWCIPFDMRSSNTYCKMWFNLFGENGGTIYRPKKVRRISIAALSSLEPQQIQQNANEICFPKLRNTSTA